ncbi:hypothetical protein [Saccharothrix longispora]|uniref:hypothetical protein n=1 Tax=Saccharothrix longispora TaxID=33920 RepID=UPI0028FD8262|nr:hypothetical protein [Saccharothrix longispora]MDU0292677.1 hypothetical protein [Saccharothrix longispora]
MRAHRYQVSLIVVAAIGDQVTSTIHDTQAADHHSGISSMRSNNTLAEFLRRRAEFAIPAGVPVLRFDTTDEAVSFAFRTRGPSHLEYLSAGVVQRPDGAQVPYQGQPWDELAGFYVGGDLYVLLAEQAGMRVERTTEHD